MSDKKKLIRITTIPQSLATLIKGQPKFMSSYYDVICISSDGQGVLDSVSEYEGTRVIPVNMTRNITPLQDLKATWQLYKVFRKERPDIVHTHTPKAGTVGMLAAYLARVPNRLHTIAGLPLLEISGAKRKLLDLVEKLTYRCASKIYPNSFGLHDIIVDQNYAPLKKLKVIANGSSNGIDVSHYDPGMYSEEDNKAFRKGLDFKDSDYVFVFVGRLVKDKGINEMVSAFKTIAARHPNAKLLLVGPFEKSPENVLKDSDALLPETIEFIKSNEQVRAVGLQKDVRPYLAVSDCLVFPSYREGFPNVVMQAGSMGLPTIASNINGCNEIVIPGQNGVLIPKKDAPAIEEAMSQFLIRGKVDGASRERNRKMIEDRFSQPIVWKALLEEYGQLGI